MNALNEKEVKVDVYVLCYNEEKLVPFMLDYWAEFATNVYVCDNMSTDNSVELLLKEKRFNIEILTYNSNNELNDGIFLYLKNNIWKRSIGKCDFVVMCDFDEALYSNNIIGELKYMKDNNMTICFPKIFDMYSQEFPTYDVDLLHDIIKLGFPYQEFGKRLLFNPNEIKEINYAPGAHSCFPIGNVKYYDRENLFLFHYKSLSIEYILNRYKIYRERLSMLNKNNKWGIQYSFEDQKSIDFFNETYSKCVNVKDYI